MTLLAGELLATRLKASADGGPDPLVVTPAPDVDAVRKKVDASLEVHLGTWFLTLRPARMESLKVKEVQEARATKLHYVPFGKPYFLHPRSFVLGVTFEWFRFPNDLAAYVVGKSSWGRRGLVIATATGVHPAFVGCLTLELSNVGEIPVELKPGIPICQLFIHTVEGNGPSGVTQGRHRLQRRPSLGQIGIDGLAKTLASAEMDG